MSGQKIIDGLRDLIEFADGDNSKAVRITVTGSADFARANNPVVYIYDPRDPKGTMQRHEVASGEMVEVPSGWVVAPPSTVPDDVKVGISAREKDYGI